MIKQTYIASYFYDGSLNHFAMEDTFNWCLNRDGKEDYEIMYEFECAGRMPNIKQIVRVYSKAIEKNIEPSF